MLLQSPPQIFLCFRAPLFFEILAFKPQKYTFILQEFIHILVFYLQVVFVKRKTLSFHLMYQMNSWILSNVAEELFVGLPNLCFSNDFRNTHEIFSTRGMNYCMWYQWYRRTFFYAFQIVFSSLSDAPDQLIDLFSDACRRILHSYSLVVVDIYSRVFRRVCF